MIVQILKKIKMLLVLPVAVLLLLYCQDPEDAARDSAERERLRNKAESPLRVTGSDNAFGRYNRSDYEGPVCNDRKVKNEQPDEYTKCTEICKKVYSSQRKKCEKLPTGMLKTN